MFFLPVVVTQFVFSDNFCFSGSARSASTATNFRRATTRSARRTCRPNCCRSARPSSTRCPSTPKERFFARLCAFDGSASLSSVVAHSPSEPKIPATFLFVIDVALIEEELQALKDCLLMSFSLLPPESLVGLITVGTTVRFSVRLIAFCCRKL
jgi:hypothetical protein